MARPALERMRTFARPDPAILQTLLDASPDAIVIVDGRGCIVYANAPVQRLFGYAPEIGRAHV